MGRIKLSLVLILCAFKCFAMSFSELDDFAEYLTKTSQLTPSLKQGTDEFDEYDEGELVSDNAWEESGKFEGDLILNERQRRLIVQNVAEQGLARNGIIDAAKRWPNNEVIFAIQVEHFSNDQVQAILDGIDDLARASCVKFRRYRQGDRDAVVIQGNRRGCFSQVGYQGGFQALNLNSRHPVGRGCFRHGTVVHELLHSLGFYHMQSSPDRDDYVDIVWDNILKSSRHNFRKYNTFTVSDFGVGYDYDSVLHYSRNAFSINGKATIVPKQGGAEIGQRLGLSDKDTQKLNKMYCDADSDNVQSVGDSPQKSKKKSTKNKPFDGHGLGYHKGTAVVFKLTPEAETYKLDDVPSSHIFDYFSKQPQTLSSVENHDFHNGNKIAYSFKTPEPLITQEYKEDVSYDTELNNLRKKELNEETQLAMPELININQANVGEPSEEVNKAKSPTESLHAIQDDEENPELIEAFDRLSKMIKSHVYPSQTPDLTIYRLNDRFQKLKSNEEVQKSNDYSALENIKHPLWEEETPEIVTKAYKDFIPIISTNSYYKIRPVENINNKVLMSTPNYEDKYEHISYKKLPKENKYERESSKIQEEEKTSPVNQDGWLYSYAPYKDGDTKYNFDDKYGDQSYERYPDEEEYEKKLSLLREKEKLHSNQEGWLHTFTPYKNSANANNRERFFDYSKNLSKGNDSGEFVKTHY